MHPFQHDALTEQPASPAAASDPCAPRGEGVAPLASRPETSQQHLVGRLAAAAFEALLRAIDVNDPDTGAHVRRVAASAVVIARAADCDPARQCRVERVALFHDLGKINGVLFDVLHLTTGLSADERRLIATHADRGAEVLAPLAPFYPELPDAVRAHHEWWNGHGYPRRLRGTAIPFEARVVAIADVFDALTSDRRYRPALRVADARGFIAAGRGTQFDPDLADLFLAPPVQAEIAALSRAHRHRATGPENGTGGDARGRDAPRSTAPEISFRWRATTDD